MIDHDDDDDENTVPVDFLESLDLIAEPALLFL